jgi:hypothetical protein
MSTVRSRAAPTVPYSVRRATRWMSEAALWDRGLVGQDAPKHMRAQMPWTKKELTLVLQTLPGGAQIWLSVGGGLMGEHVNVLHGLEMQINSVHVQEHNANCANKHVGVCRVHWYVCICRAMQAKCAALLKGTHCHWPPPNRCHTAALAMQPSLPAAIAALEPEKPVWAHCSFLSLLRSSRCDNNKNGGGLCTARLLPLLQFCLARARQEYQTRR